MFLRRKFCFIKHPLSNVMRWLVIFFLSILTKPTPLCYASIVSDIILPSNSPTEIEPTSEEEMESDIWRDLLSFFKRSGSPSFYLQLYNLAVFDPMGFKGWLASFLTLYSTDARSESEVTESDFFFKVVRSWALNSILRFLLATFEMCDSQL